MKLILRLLLLSLGLSLGFVGWSWSANAQTSCTPLNQPALMALFSDNASPSSITPANIRSLVCSLMGSGAATVAPNWTAGNVPVYGNSGLAGNTTGAYLVDSGLTPPGGLSPVFNIVTFGAAPNKNSGAAIQAAINAASAAGGGIVWVPPGGDAYIVDVGLTLPSGVVIQGAGGLNWVSPIDNNRTDWTNKSSWLWCQDGSRPCIIENGNGAQIRGLNFWYTQTTPIPSTQCASPCTYVPYSETGITPFTILVNTSAAVGNWISDVNIANATNCVDWEGPGSGISGAYSGIEHSSFGCLNTGIKFRRVDNTLMLNNIRHELWWYQGTAQWWWIMQNNVHVDWDVGYLANPQMTNIEFSFGGKNIVFTDQTVSSGFGPITLAATNMQASNISFNETCTAMSVASSVTHVTGNFTNVIAASDSTTSPVAGQCTRAQPYFFNLASDNVNIFLTGLNGAFVQSLAFIGGGNVGPQHGQLHIAGALVSNFSAYANGADVVDTDSTGSIVSFDSTPFFYPSSTFTSGALCGGTGCTMKANYVESNLEIGGAANTTRQVTFSSVPVPPLIGNFIGKQDWAWRDDIAANNFNLDRFSGAGVYVDSPITVNKANGVIGMPDGLTVTGLMTFSPTGAGAAANYVCTDSLGHLVVQAAAC